MEYLITQSPLLPFSPSSILFISVSPLLPFSQSPLLPFFILLRILLYLSEFFNHSNNNNYLIQWGNGFLNIKVLICRR